MLAGEAIEIVGRRFQGTAQRTQNVQKSVTNLADSFKDLAQVLAGAALQFVNSGGLLDNLAAIVGGITDDIGEFLGVTDRLTEGVRKTGEAAQEAAPKFGEFGDSIEDAERNFRNFVLDFAAANEVIDENREAIVIGGEAYDEFGNRLPTDELGEVNDAFTDGVAAIEANSDALRRNIEQQRRLREEARQTTNELQQLAIALGVDPNDPNLALTQGGTRLRFTGGSRLTGRTGFTTTAGTFTFRDGRRVRVDPSGRVIESGLA